MSTTKSISSEKTFRIVSPMGADGVMTIEDATGETREVVDYVDGLVREKLATRDAGTTVRLELTPVRGREEAYTATRVVPGGLPQPGL